MAGQHWAKVSTDNQQYHTRNQHDVWVHLIAAKLLYLNNSNLTTRELVCIDENYHPILPHSLSNVIKGATTTEIISLRFPPQFVLSTAP